MAEPLTVTLEVKGLAELDAMLRAIPEEVAGPIMRDALTAAGGLIRTAAAENIHRRSGQTAADLRVQVQVFPEENSGAAAIGGTKKGRAYILRWLEFGAHGKRQGGKGWDMKGGAEDVRQTRQTVRALRKIGQGEVAASIRRAISAGDITKRRALGKWPSGIPGIGFRAAAHHPGFAGYSPLTRALASSGAAAIDLFATTLWRRLTGTISRFRQEGKAA